MAQWIKCLMDNHEDPSSDPLPHKKSGTGVHPCIPSAGKREMRGSIHTALIAEAPLSPPMGKEKQMFRNERATTGSRCSSCSNSELRETLRPTQQSLPCTGFYPESQMAESKMLLFLIDPFPVLSHLHVFTSFSFKATRALEPQYLPIDQAALLSHSPDNSVNFPSWLPHHV